MRHTPQVLTRDQDLSGPGLRVGALAEQQRASRRTPGPGWWTYHARIASAPFRVCCRDASAGSGERDLAVDGDQVDGGMYDGHRAAGQVQHGVADRAERVGAAAVARLPTTSSRARCASAASARGGWLCTTRRRTATVG